VPFPVLKILLLTLLSFSALSGPHLHIYFTPQARPFAERLAANSEKWRSYVESTAGVALPADIDVYMVRQRSELDTLRLPPHTFPVWAQAIALPQQRVIIIKTEGIHSFEEFREIFIHEYTHLLLGGLFAEQPIPVWLHEGLAMQLSGEWSISRIITMSQAVLSGRIIPLQNLMASFPEDEFQAKIAYAESYYVISFFLHEFGAGALGSFIKDYARGFGYEQALFRSTGLKEKDFQKKWKRFISLRFSWLPIGFSAGAFWFLVTLVFIFAAMRKRKRSKEILAAWREEEENASKLYSGATPPPDDDNDDGPIMYH